MLCVAVAMNTCLYGRCPTVLFVLTNKKSTMHLDPSLTSDAAQKKINLNLSQAAAGGSCHVVILPLLT